MLSPVLPWCLIRPPFSYFQTPAFDTGVAHVKGPGLHRWCPGQAAVVTLKQALGPEDWGASGHGACTALARVLMA